MKKYLFTIVTFVLCLSTFAQDSIINLLPSPFDLPGMQFAGEPEVSEGEDLFDLINTGAEVYLEYGFVQVVSQNYSGITGKSSLRVEIYQMTDPEAAYGIFSLTAVSQNIIDKTAYYLVSGEGYGMMQKGSYFIIASYANLHEDLEQSIIKRIAEGLKSNIKELAQFPGLLASTQPPCMDFRHSLYFRGIQALSSLAYLDFKIAFEFSEGVFYRCDMFDYMLFLPSDDKSRNEILQETISNILKKNPDFTPVKETFGFSIKENNHLRYEILPDGDKFVIIKYL